MAVRGRAATPAGFALALLLVCVPALATGSTSLTMVSDAGDNIGQGQTYSYTPADGSFLANALFGNGLAISLSGAASWTLDFAPPSGRPLTPGIYEGATRWPFQSPVTGGLSVDGLGRGCNTLTGRFVVLDAQYGSGGIVQSFAADFEQHCEGAIPALFGSIRYNSDIGLGPRISVASTASYEGNGEPKGLTFWLSQSARADVPVTVDYATVDDTARAGIDYVAVAGTVTFAPGQTAVHVDVPILGNTAPQPDRRLFLSLSNPVGAPIAFGQATGTIVDDDAARTFLSFQSDPGDWVGGGQTFTLTPLEGTITAESLTNGVGISFKGSTWWGASFTAPSGLPLNLGIYEGAAARFQSPLSPGLEVSGDGRVCGTLTGRFVILEAQVSPGGLVQRFAADYEQHCQGLPPALLGSVRFNSLVATGPRLSVASASSYEGDGEPRNLTFWISLSARVSTPVTVDYATVNDTARAGIDYTAVSGTATFAPGQTAVQVDVPIIGNTIPQPDRRLFLTLSNPVGAPIAFGQAIGTILDDDSPRTFLRVESDPGDWIGEGQKLTLTPLDGTFSATGVQTHVDVSFSGLTTWGLDFAAPSGGTLTPGIYEGAARSGFQPPGAPGLEIQADGHGCNTITGRFLVLDAQYAPGDVLQTFAADFEQHCDGASAALLGSIRYNSLVPLGPRISVASATTYEGDGEPRHLTFWLSLSARASTAVSVNYATSDDTAQAGIDYSAVSGTAIFQPGQTAVEVDVPVLGNTNLQPDRRLFLSLSSPVGAPIAVGQATGTIQDDDSGRTFLYFNSQPGDWAGGGQTLMLTPLDGTISVSGGEAGLRFTFQGLGWWFLDFYPPSGVPLMPGIYEGATRWPFQSPTTPGLSVAGGGCNTLTGRFVVLDVKYDPSGTPQSLAIDYEQHCEGAAPALFGSVRYNSLVPMGPRISIASASIFNWDNSLKQLTFWLSLSAPAGVPVSVNYATSDDTAKAGVDYSAASGTATFAPGQTTLPVIVTILGNLVPQSDRKFFLTLSNPVGAPIAFGQATGTILEGAARTLLYFDSDPGDWLGGGKKFTVTPIDGTISIGGSASGVQMHFHGSTWWDLYFYPPSGVPLTTGIYDGATRYPFQPPATPGLDVSGDGRGCNTSTGRFVVLEAQYTSGGAIQSFAADYEQHCDGGVPTLFGSARYNSTIPVTPRIARAGFFTLAPCRLLDTRQTYDPLQGSTTRMFTAAGTCGIPSTAKALAVNVTAVSPTSAGDLRVYTPGFAAVANTLIFIQPGHNRAGNTIVSLNLGTFTIQCDMPGNPNGTTHVVVDVNGYFQ